MSEQSPWGQPPPSYGQPPTYGQPAAGNGYPPPPPGHGPPNGPPGGWGPPPRKRNTAAIIAIITGVLVAVAAVVITLVVTTGGDEVDQAGDDTTTSEVADDPTTETSTKATQSPAPTDPATSSDPGLDPGPEVQVPDDAIVGDGYYFELPGIGWQDALAEARRNDLGSTLDSIIILGTSLDQAQSNILVEALTAGGAPDPEALESQWKRNLSGDDGAVAQDVDDIMIDGERAIGTQFIDRVNVNGVLIDQIIYLALHDGNQYSVALSLPSENDTVSKDDLEKVLASWTWTD